MFFLCAGLTEIKTQSMRLRRMNRQRFAPDMKPFSNHRAKRNGTFVALLVWLFALASGMANACLLETPGGHSHVAATHSSDSPHSHALAGHAVAVEDDDGDDRDGSKESCLKACDDGANAQVKLQTGTDLTDPGLAPFVVIVWNTATPIASLPNRYDILQVPIVGPPFRLRYSRLTL